MLMGDIEIFADCLVASNCIATEPCEILFIPLEVYETNLKFDSNFNQLLLKELAYKLLTCTISSKVNALSPVSVRLAAYLCTLEFPSHVNQYIKTNSLDDVASLIGTTKRHLNRILKNWTEKEIIDRKEKGIQILDWDKIKEICLGLFIILSRIILLFCSHYYRLASNLTNLQFLVLVHSTIFAGIIFASFNMIFVSTGISTLTTSFSNPFFYI
ncbi:Crp/Fnr family transcriptional regulator [Lysinibacillus capsici]|uniref:Crp/Fnr family transcriptional regulator n=1 Tax=Lysinibacillus capsici TaxID=2115968 RepID=UPI0034E5CFC6